MCTIEHIAVAVQVSLESHSKILLEANSVSRCHGDKCRLLGAVFREGIRPMASVFDVASYILKKCGPMSHMKLQKLVYYAQAWSLVWDEKPLFKARIEAWANGPVVPQLFRELRQRFNVSFKDIPSGNADALGGEEKKTVDSVLKFYGCKNPQWLSDLTHMEAPWVNARRGLKPGERGESEISHADMAWYYGSL